MAKSELSTVVSKKILKIISKNAKNASKTLDVFFLQI